MLFYATIRFSTVPSLIGRIVDRVDAHVDDDRARFDPIAAHHFWPPDGRNQNISLRNDKHIFQTLIQRDGLKTFGYHSLEKIRQLS